MGEQTYITGKLSGKSGHEYTGLETLTAKVTVNNTNDTIAVDVTSTSGLGATNGVQIINDVASIKLQEVSNGLSVNASGLTLGVASQTSAGAISAADKTKLDNLQKTEYIELTGWSESSGWHDGGTLSDAQAQILLQNELNYIWMNGMHRLDFRYKDDNYNLATYSSNDGIKTHVIEVKLSDKTWRYTHTQLQEKLTAGNNIQITNNVISATDTVYDDTEVRTLISAKQDTLVSGTNIKTINGNSVLGSGDLTIGGNVDDVKVNGTSVVTNKVANITVPTKTSELTNDSGFLTQHQDISGKQDKLTAGTNITIDENNVISASGGQSVDFDNKTIIKDSTNKYQTAIGGWKETTPEQSTELFIDTKGNGLHTYIGPGTAAYEAGWDYNTTITSLASGASEVIVSVKFTVLGTTFNNKITLYKQSSFPISWESNEIIINDAYYKVKVHDQYVGINNGGICVVAVDTGADLEGSTMQSCALVTGSSSTIYHPIDNKFLKIDNSLVVDEDNKLKVNQEVVQSKLTAGTNVTISNNVISATDTIYDDTAVKNRLTAIENQESTWNNKQDKLTAGTNITIDASNVISAIGSSTMGRTFTTDITVGHLASGTQIKSTDTIADILYKILYEEQPVTTTAFYYGAIDGTVPTVADLTSLTKVSDKTAEQFIASGHECTIISHYISSIDDGQTPVVATTKDLEMTAWKNKATGWAYSDYTRLAIGDYVFYYFNHRVDNEPEGEVDVFTFTGGV